MKKSVLYLTALIFCLSSFGCAITPKRVEVSPMARAVPVDKIYYVPWALGSGLINSFIWAFEDIAKKPWNPFSYILMAPLNLAQGFLFTTFDTSVNIVYWLPLEVSEMITSETWETPFMGFYSRGTAGYGEGWTYMVNDQQSKNMDDKGADGPAH